MAFGLYVLRNVRCRLKLKNHNRAAFTLLETLLALALSGFIMAALMQAYQTLVKYIGNAREISTMNRRLATITQVIERDLSSACMPQLHEVIKSNKENALSSDEQERKDEAEKNKKELSADEKKQRAEKKMAERKKYFFAQIDDADFHKFKGKKVELLKTCGFITTHALEFFGESSQRWVRVQYELIKDKKAKTPQYTLVRKQSNNIANLKMKISDVDAAENIANPITVHEVMRGIKGLFIEFSMLKMLPQKENQPNAKKVEPELIKAFAWGESKKTAGEFAQRAHVYLDLWNEEQTRSDMVELEISIFADGNVEAVLIQELEMQELEQQNKNNFKGAPPGRDHGGNRTKESDNAFNKARSLSDKVIEAFKNNTGKE